MRYYNSEVAAYFSDIEDLTHKTGNFKQFTVFVNMLESALAKVSKYIYFLHIEMLLIKSFLFFQHTLS